jgi:hypothetical protein
MAWIISSMVALFHAKGFSARAVDESTHVMPIGI